MRTRIHCAVVAALALALCVAAPPAAALDRPQSSPKDQRIRWTDYDPADVVQIDTTLGVATQIQLTDDEDYVTHAFGDSAAYDFQQIGKHLLLKPIVEQADTNLVYITTKRNYSFLLKYAKQRNGREVFRVVLRYPETDRTKSAAQADRERIQQDLAAGELAINWQNYTMSGDTDIGPEAAWDDGAQTWLRFAPGQDLPTVYFVDPDGNEVITNRHMDGDRTIVLQRTASRWHLRLGQKVLAIHNDGRTSTRTLPTGTVSPTVERVLREEPLP
ncbi:TrbG/VirB9 family P-type conjugative transfer protein [Achromobacter ruhlandii]|uniref:TrbG/VirB9 family P-type conjugative transfer protein n=1 Tax=Achromobacter ruhlandii TaxID=72557 RepID=A0A848NFT6_9BURK|nr:MULTISPECIES: TrbG/VirB9 family P-type conjugative transfer protein [Achromobacter]NMU89780.1 TrbG/VirB9 family P-type conjugative transfer protein [Achromobacter ruhlandii]